MERIRLVLSRYVSVLVFVLTLTNSLSAQNTSPLCFTARNGSVTVRFEIKNVTHTIQYSTNGSTWSTYASNTNLTINANQSVYFRAASNQTYATAFGAHGTAYTNCSRFYLTSSDGGTVEGSGNIMSLYGPNCPNLSLSGYAFAYLFYGCTLLTTAPELPATTLASYCYGWMFQGCTSLVSAPALPATTLSVGCYQSMFSDCSSLTTTPALPAMRMYESCYYYMFGYCTSLTTISSLPATTLAKCCYSYMFYGCTSLAMLPSLPATALAELCYWYMFKNCTSIHLNRNAPGQPWMISATSAQTGALNDMFTGTGGTMNGTPATNTTYYIFGYTITTNVNDASMGSVTGGGFFQSGGVATLTATPNAHYHFVRWSDGNTSNPRTVTVSGDATYAAVFEGDIHTITVSGQNGSVLGGGQYHYGSTATLTATANQHYHFLRWSDGNTSNPRTVTVSGNASYTAVFEGDLHTITASGQNGTVSGGGQYNYGTTATLTATPYTNYHFLKWSDNNTSNPRTITVSGDATYTAVFEGNMYAITANGQNGTVSGGGQYRYGTTATLTATANQHYHFLRWSDGITSNPRTVTVSGNATYTAVFEGDLQMITAYGQNGVVSGGGQHNYGSMATLTATANQYYHFAGWTDGNKANPRIIVVGGDSTFIAVFEPNKYIVSSNSYLVSGTGEYEYGSNVTLTAHSEEHYRFVRWADGSTDSVYSFYLYSGDTTIVAIYNLDSFNIAASCQHGIVIGAGIYGYNDVATIYVNPDAGYRFVQWSDGDEYNPRIIIVRGDLEVEAICEEVPMVGVENVDGEISFYYVDGKIVNPEGMMLRVYSAAGVMVRSGDEDILLIGLPAGVYMVVDERGRALKVAVR